MAILLKVGVCMVDRGDIADDNLNDMLEKRNNKASCSIPNKRHTSSTSSSHLHVKFDMSHLGRGVVWAWGYDMLHMHCPPLNDIGKGRKNS